MKFKFLIATLFICMAAFSQKATVTGKISDKDLSNEPLAFATVMVKGTTIGVTTGEDGRYSLQVKPGNYVLVISFVGYEPAEVPFTAKENETVTIDRGIGSGSVKLEDIVVTQNINREKETALLLEQKNAVEIKQSIGAQEMSRKGVSDVEQGLTKITGITKVDSRGIFVRGLEDRYNNLLINGLAAPTNNPFKKIIPLDLFSTDIVGVIDVFKTFNTNIYGDFAGGTFNLNTARSSKSITKLSIGAGYTINNNLRNFLMSDDDASGTKGFFGFNGKDRELPGFLGSAPAAYEFTAAQSRESLKSGFDVKSKKSPLNTSVGVLHAEKFSLEKERSFSYLLSLNFENAYTYRAGADRTYDISDLDAGFQNITNFRREEYHYKTSSSSLLGFAYSTPKLKLYLNTLYIRTTDNMIQDQTGTANVTLANQLIRTNQLEKTDYLNTQLTGEYALNSDKTEMLKAGVSFAKTNYGQPDRKFFQGTLSADGKQVSTVYGANNFLRQYLTVDGNYFFSGMAEYIRKFGKDSKNKLTVGYNGNGSSMESSYRFLSPVSDAPAFVAEANKLDNILINDINNGSLHFRESSNATYKAKLEEFANAGYADLFLKLAEKWELNAGIRFESTTRTTEYRPLGAFSAPFKKLTYNNQYFLPSVNLKYLASESSNIRFAASKTYTRPVIMEAFPITYINADGTSIQGNPLLKNSDNYNADLKYELFPTSKELFAIGVFGKYLDTPIERTNVANATTSTITTYLNSDNAKLYGAEAEFILDLKRLSENLSDFSFGMNATAMTSKVAVAENYKSIDETGTITSHTSIETHRSRQLQGASNWLVNADLKYQFNFNKDWSNTATLVYGSFGKRIYAVGTNGQDHIYELPYQQLDFVWSSTVSQHINLKFTVDNILDPRRQLQLGDDGSNQAQKDLSIARDYRKGVGFSLKLDYTF